MTRSLTRLLPIAALGMIPLALASVTPPVAAPLPHPHFPKTLICAIPNGPTITVKHLTVTFDREGAKKMAAGQAWHLAGATSVLPPAEGPTPANISLPRPCTPQRRPAGRLEASQPNLLHGVALGVCWTGRNERGVSDRI